MKFTVFITVDQQSDTMPFGKAPKYAHILTLPTTCTLRCEAFLHWLMCNPESSGQPTAGFRNTKGIDDGPATTNGCTHYRTLNLFSTMFKGVNALSGRP